MAHAGPEDQTEAGTGKSADVLAPSNLVAWCIVPFDASQRSPAERAEMLADLGLKRCAYDWRAEHVPTFEEEILEYKRHGIEFFAFWDAHPAAFELFQKHDLHPQVWRTAPSPDGKTDDDKVAAAVESLRPLCETTRDIGCKLGLYNHGGWGGEPENLVAVCRRLRELGYDHVGIVYNFHHGHGHIANFAEALDAMQPYLLCLNLNGMNDDAQPKILGIGKGQHERAMIRAILDAGYEGPIGILDHQPERDTREALAENLEGLARVRAELAESCRKAAAPAASQSGAAPVSPAEVEELAGDAREDGDPRRGARLFADARSACLSCHKVLGHGGAVGPDLSQIGKQRTTEELAWSLLAPQREVKPEFLVWKVATDEGKVHTGYRVESDDDSVRLRDPALGTEVAIPRPTIEDEVQAGSLMPEGLLARLSYQQRADLVGFLAKLGTSDAEFDAFAAEVLATPQVHSPVAFPYQRDPLVPEDYAHWQAPVNRDRVYDFYTKQAEYFRSQPVLPMLLSEAPALDGGTFGHWGNQDEEFWADDRWNDTQLGSVQCGIFRDGKLVVARAVCLQLGEDGELAVCFNPETLHYEALWSGGFVNFSSVRHGFLGGLQRDGTPLPLPEQTVPEGPRVYHGFYRHGKRVVFAYRIGDVEYLDAPWVEDGEFVRVVTPADEHPLRELTSGGSPQWPQEFATEIRPGSGRPYAIDTIELPFDNPWKALLFCGGHDFLSDGSAVIGTMQGDVWRVEGLDGPMDQPGQARWRRIAAGLHHLLGVVVVDDVIHVLGRDQITRLHDRNDDGEIDFYECFSRAYDTSTAGHDFICGLQRDEQGRFYTASGNQGILRISADGNDADVLATGFRNPDGLCLLDDGTLTVPCSEGDWTCASMIGAFRPSESTGGEVPHFGYRGPRNGRPPELPLVYLPRLLDNSSGGQVQVTGDRWGPLDGQLVHLSFGAGTYFLVLRDEVHGQMQGAAVPLPGDFRSGVHRGRFHPHDGQLYVSGMAGWGSYTPDDGCFQRVRYTGDAAQLPVDFHVHENGVVVRFSQPLDPEIAARSESHFAQCWNYRYSSAYGSPEFSTTHPGVRGHDPLAIASAHVLEDGRSLFLELPELQPVNQLHLRLHIDGGRGHDLLATVHALDRPFADFPGYRPRPKTIAPHPILADMAMSAERVPNPYQRPLKNSRQIELATGKNLTYAEKEIRVQAGEPLEFTLVNPDVVPHNWALAVPGSLAEVGQMANLLVADPAAVARQYIPESDDVLAHTDVVPPGGRFTIYFHAPKKPGRYPFLCTFPGHWMVMNGELVVE
ncbi:MAG: heme-binding domain-containing protein [Planctomycetota bacterium]|nr:MAG: heme-binding domain-containing protein [Planctomycetota bacterium]